MLIVAFIGWNILHEIALKTQFFWHFKNLYINNHYIIHVSRLVLGDTGKSAFSYKVEGCRCKFKHSFNEDTKEHYERFSNIKSNNKVIITKIHKDVSMRRRVVLEIAKTKVAFLCFHKTPPFQVATTTKVIPFNNFFWICQEILVVRIW